jgi:hypothetical protein
MKVEDSGTCSNIASPDSLAAVNAANGTQATATKHICYSIISTLLTGYWRELYREAFQYPDNLDLLACTLVEVPYS